MAYLETPYLQVSSGTDIFLSRLAGQEADRLAARLKINGVHQAACKRFQRDAETVLHRAIHEDPSGITEDIDAVVDQVSRSVISGRKRAAIISDMGAGMTRAAVLVSDRARPQPVSDPFNDTIEITPIELDDNLQIA
jgi:hypothetical protein